MVGNMTAASRKAVPWRSFRCKSSPIAFGSILRRSEISVSSAHWRRLCMVSRWRVETCARGCSYGHMRCSIALLRSMSKMALFAQLRLRAISSRARIIRAEFCRFFSAVVQVSRCSPEQHRLHPTRGQSLRRTLWRYVLVGC